MPRPLFDSVIKRTFTEAEELVEELSRNREIVSQGKASFINVYNSSNVFNTTTTTQNIYNQTTVITNIYNQTTLITNIYNQTTIIGATDTDLIYHMIGGNPIGADGTNRFTGVSGYNGIGATEGDRQQAAVTSFTAQSLVLRVSANSAAAANHVVLRKNGADTALGLNVGAGATGIFRNSTATVSIAADDLLSLDWGAAGTITFTSAGFVGKIV